MIDDTIKKEAHSFLDKMSIEQQVGQLFILAFPGKDPNILSEIIHRYGIAGCYISQDNAETFSEATQLCKKLNSVINAEQVALPPILGVDQEGAWGVLIPESTIGPGNLALGTSDSTMHTETMYRIFAREMASVGYQAILGPCADVNLNPRNSIIGTRSFGEHAERVACHVQAAVKAIQSESVLATAKHFPGHGDTLVDTHRDIPVVDKPIDILLQEELLPFQSAVDAGVDMIMTAHILFPQLDAEFPATLSPKILTDLLRKKMGFEGLIITDSMNMGAMRKHYDPQDASVLAFLAGADLIMLSEEHYDHDTQYLERQIASIKGIVTAVKEGKIPQHILHDRVLRVLQTRIRLRDSAKNSNVYVSVDNKEQKQHKEQESIIARQAIKVVKDTKQLLPLQKQQSISLINCTPQSSYYNLMNVRGIGPNQAISAFESFVHTYKKYNQSITVFSYEDVERDYQQLVTFDRVIAVTEDYPFPGEDFEKTKQQECVKMLMQKVNDALIVVGLRSAYELEDYQELHCYVCSYSSRTCSAIAMAQFLCNVY